MPILFFMQIMRFLKKNNNVFLKKIFLVIFFLINSLNFIKADVIQTKGESVFKSNINLGCNRALEEARKKAHMAIGSAKISSIEEKYCDSSQNEELCTITQLSNFHSESIIVSEKKISSKIEELKINQENIYTCDVVYEFELKKIDLNKNIYFDVKINEDTFLAPITPELEKISTIDDSYPNIQFSITTSKPTFFYIYQQLNYLEDDTNLFLIYPNLIDENKAINDGSKIPINDQDYSFKISFPRNVDEKSIIVPVVIIGSKVKLDSPLETSNELLGKFLLKNSQNIDFKKVFYSVFKK